MRRRSSRRVLLAAAALPLLLLAACSGAVAGGAVARRPAEDERGPWILATLRPGNERIWSKVAEELAVFVPVQLRASWWMRSIGEQCLVLELPRSGDPESAVARIRQHPRVSTATVSRRFRLLGRDADPYADLQSSIGPLRLGLAHRAATGRGVSVAIVDTGLQIDHPDLADRIRRANDFVGEGRGAFTSEFHGTAVAGVVAASAGNGIGGQGVAPEAELWALRACWQDASGRSGGSCDSYTLAQALDLAIAERADVINLSLVGPYDALVERLVLRAIEKREVVVVAAEGEAPGFPASVPGVVAVHGWDGNRPQPAAARPSAAALAAPAFDILTTVPEGSFDFVSGSSFSAAQASGVVALLLERRPDLGPAEIERILRETASRRSADAPALLDACAALASILDENLCGD